jgi:hypothetical protein
VHQVAREERADRLEDMAVATASVKEAFKRAADLRKKR